MSLFLEYGGLPYLKALPLQDNIVFEYLKNIYSTIAIRDIVNRYSLRNMQFLEQLTQLMASEFMYKPHLPLTKKKLRKRIWQLTQNSRQLPQICGYNGRI